MINIELLLSVFVGVIFVLLVELDELKVQKKRSQLSRRRNAFDR
jgi:hypothetical protein